MTCQGSVPQALIAFLDSKNFEDSIRNTVRIGGDSDTIGAMAGSIAEAYYGVSIEMKEKHYRIYLKTCNTFIMLLVR